MSRVWSYPWTLAAEGLETSLADLADRGVDTVSVATQYHSVRSFQPRVPADPFDAYAGGCYFSPDPERFAGTPIDPIENDVPGLDDPLGDVVDAADDLGLDVASWTVCLHNTRLGAENPGYRVEDAFGTPHDVALCPSHPAVREYFAAVVENVVDYGVSSVELEAVGYPDVCHSHGLGWGHEKRQALASDANRRLLSQCFCEACRKRAREWGLDVDRARDVVRSLLRDALAEPVDDPPSLADLADEHRAVDRLLAFRADTVETFVARLAAAAGSTTVNTYVLDPAAMAATGVRLADVEDHLDRVTAICYVDEPAAARERLRAVGERVALPVDAGISLDPDLVGSEADFRALVDAALDETDGEVSAYHHGLVTEAQLDWIERVLG